MYRKQMQSTADAGNLKICVHEYMTTYTQQVRQHLWWAQACKISKQKLAFDDSNDYIPFNKIMAISLPQYHFPAQTQYSLNSQII